jgi:hypothetical protein
VRARTPTVRPRRKPEGGEEEASGPTVRRPFICTPPSHWTRGTEGSTTPSCSFAATGAGEVEGSVAGAEEKSRPPPVLAPTTGEGEEPEMGRAAIRASPASGSTRRQSTSSAPLPTHAPPVELPKMEPPWPRERGSGEVGAEEPRAAPRLADGGVRRRS